MHGAQRDTLLPPGFLLTTLGVEAVVIARCDTLLPPGFLLTTLGAEAVVIARCDTLLPPGFLPTLGVEAVESCVKLGSPSRIVLLVSVDVN